MIVLALFGLLAIAIAAAGIYGVMAYLVEQRQQEIGVRMALGADPTQVLRMVLVRASLYVSLGLDDRPDGRLDALEIRTGVSLQAGRARSDRLHVGRRASSWPPAFIAWFVPGSPRGPGCDPVAALRS